MDEVNSLHEVLPIEVRSRRTLNKRPLQNPWNLAVWRKRWGSTSSIKNGAIDRVVTLPGVPILTS